MVSDDPTQYVCNWHTHRSDVRVEVFILLVLIVVIVLVFLFCVRCEIADLKKVFFGQHEVLQHFEFLLIDASKLEHFPTLAAEALLLDQKFEILCLVARRFDELDKPSQSGANMVQVSVACLVEKAHQSSNQQKCRGGRTGMREKKERREQIHQLTRHPCTR